MFLDATLCRLARAADDDMSVTHLDPGRAMMMGSDDHSYIPDRALPEPVVMAIIVAILCVGVAML